MKTARQGVLEAILCVSVAAVILAACGQGSQQGGQPANPEATPPAQQPASTPVKPAHLECPACGDDCSNYPFQPTDCWTTQHGPAKADVVDGTTNLLYCKDTPFALCFFSGPPTPTGTNPQNPPLPCKLDPKTGTANCTCQAFRQDSYVDINGILNLGAWQETVKLCGTDGSGCANLQNKQLQEAPVCKYVRQQDPNDPKVSLIPKADIISTFSPTAMKPSYRVGKSPLKGDCEGQYAGCMTAPCFFPQGTKRPFANGAEVQCQCPTFTGKFQVGQFKQQCDIPSGDGTTYVWSAANNVQGSSLE